MKVMYQHMRTSGIMTKNRLKKRLLFVFAVLAHWAVTVVLLIQSIKINLDRKHKVELSSPEEFYATLIKTVKNIFSFPLLQLPAFLDSFVFLKGIPAIIAASLANSITQVSACYLLFICLRKVTINDGAGPNMKA